MRESVFLILSITLFSFVSGCASVSTTNQLNPGMSPNEVKNVMGEPSQTQFIAGKLVWKYSLHQPWKGFVPYYLIFRKEDQRLETWYANEAEYMRQQQLWLQAFPPTQKHDVDIKVR